MKPDLDHPEVIAFPPLLFAGALAAGIVLHLLNPHQALPPSVARLAGGLLLVAGAGLMSWGRQTMVRAETNVNPYMPALPLVTAGPFRYTRNQLYSSLTMLYLGISLLLNALWPILLAAPLLVVTHYGIVRREERYLEAKFGDDYRVYRARVRRWL